MEIQSPLIGSTTLMTLANGNSLAPVKGRNRALQQGQRNSHLYKHHHGVSFIFYTLNDICA